ncbi:MAG TPA: hypothetical protein VFU38_00265 [Candidatus Krumholzibacteria bacterium]|nr:hypothetical protein [Candidatus Krumholzibacteria bacterium]
MKVRASVIRSTVWLALGAVIAWTATARAQSPDRAVEFEDLGLDRWLDASARGFALSAFAATASEATALAINPAGLARAKRVSAVSTFGGTRKTFDYTWGETMHSNELDEYAVQFVGVAVPLPVLRGSLVPAFGIQRAFSAALALAYQGYNEVDARDDRLQLQQTGAAYAVHFGAGIDITSAVALGLSFFVLDGGVDLVRQYDTRGRIVEPDVHTFVFERIDSDVDGYGARAGLSLYPARWMQIALVATSPVVAELESSIFVETTRQVDNDVGSFSRVTTERTSEYKIPYRLDAALAIPASPSLLFAVQAGYCDWSQATIDDQRLITNGLEGVLRSVVDLRAGVEWSAGRWPLRVRAGAARARAAASFVEADRIDYDQLERIESETQFIRVSLGAGYIVRRRVNLDLSLGFSRAERVSATIFDTRDTVSVLLGGGYWF